VQERIDFWSEDNGTGICPEGWRVPTVDEINSTVIAESIIDRDTAWASNLKLPLAGYKSNESASIIGAGGQGGLWTTTISTTGEQTISFGYSIDAKFTSNLRARGRSVRCIKTP